MEESESCKLKYRSSKKKKLCEPYLASFPNNRIFNQNKGPVKFSCYSSTSKKQDEKLLVASMDRFDYVGTSNAVASADGQASKFCLGVLNKSTMRMKLYDAEMYHFKPLITASEASTDGSKNAKSYVEKRKTLASTFGSKLKKRTVESALQYKVEDSEINESLTTAISSSDKDISLSVSELMNSIPPQNREATDGSEVYNLSDIITDEELNELEPMALELKNSTALEIESWKDSLNHYIVYYLQKSLPNVSLHKCKLLALYHYMVQYYNTSYRKLAQKDPFAEFPDFVKNLFLKHFVDTSCAITGQQRIFLTQRMKDKLMIYSLVVALFIEDFNANITVIKQDFRLSLPRITKIAHMLGCYISKKVKEETTHYAKLKIPLFLMKEKPHARDRWANKFSK